MNATCDWRDPEGEMMIMECTNCGTQYSTSTWFDISEPNGDGPNYCPHCGAKSNLQNETKEI